MTCEHCREAVTTAIAAVNGVETVTVDPSSGMTTVTAARPVDRVGIATTIEAAGYRVLS